MKGIAATDHEVFWLAYSDDLEVVHFGRLEPGRRVDTGLDHFEAFNTENELEDRVDELKGDGYYGATHDDT